MRDATVERLISVIIPVYNAERYLRECIDSVLEQSYTNWELILVNDGSTDLSKEICTEYAERDSRVRVFHNENHGVSYTRNFGIDAAKGEYLCFVDADDKILPDYLSRLMEELEKTEANIVFCGFRLLYDDKIVKKTPRIKTGIYSIEELSCRAIDDGTLSGILFGSACAALYRSRLIKEGAVRFDAAVRINEDGLFNLELLPKAKVIAITDYTGYIYRQWKSANRKRIAGRINNELDVVSDIIAQRCGFYDALDRQLKCRTVSIAFWNSMKLARGGQSLFALAKNLKDYVSETGFHNCYDALNFSALNRYKKTLVNLLYKKRYLAFVVLVKYVKPILERRLKH